MKGKLWVKFYGTQQLGSVSKSKHWLVLSENSMTKFVNAKSLSKTNYLDAVRELLISIEKTNSIDAGFVKGLQAIFTTVYLWSSRNL